MLNDDYSATAYPDSWRWQEGDYTVTRSRHWSGPGCHSGCGLLLYTKNNKLVKVEGDPASSRTMGRLCMRCLNLPEAVNHKDRLKWPLKRIGNRGENKWERISWDTAADIIAENVHRIQKESGPESIVSMIGTGRNACWQTPYLSYAGFGSPNFSLGFLSGDACMLPRNAMMTVMAGGDQVADMSQFLPGRYDDPKYQRPEVLVIWGNNPIIANSDGFFGHWVVDLMKKGTKLIVIDPRLTWLASKADVWLRIRPGTDAALALAMINTIVKEELYDKDFVDAWTYGFEQLSERAAEMPVERAAEITWIPKEKILEAARMYAKAKPAAIQWGLAIDMQITGTGLAQAVESLWTITGNMDIPGGNIFSVPPYLAQMIYDYGYYEWLDDDMRKKRLGIDKSPLKQYGQGASAHGDTVLETIESGVPYPIKMLFMCSTNPIANMGAEAPRVYRAVKKTEFNVVCDLFMTPTAVACADIVLPVAMSCERDGFYSWQSPLAPITKVTQYHEAKSDEEVALFLGKRLHPEAFPWETAREWLDWHLRDNGNCPYSLDDLQHEVLQDYGAGYEYKKYEKGLLRADGSPGFNTPTGRIELYLTRFESWDLDPLPSYTEPPDGPYSTPERYKEYPLVLTTGYRSWEFFHSEHRQQKTMREFHPFPRVEMNPDTAADLGVSEGDWVWIENQRGRCKQIAKFNPSLDPRVVSAEHGWWYPEKDGAEPVLFGVFDTNINNLTPQCQNDQTGYGAPYKCQLCKIYPVTAENDKVTPTEIVTRKGGFGYVK